ncbi:MAG: efflux RND transporter periplasmic adaptor subunit [Gemmataceae bacterium]|nr:efflux RND transporter periplasmic adaptor subunit [Gemmataceae bacterium]
MPDAPAAEPAPPTTRPVRPARRTRVGRIAVWVALLAGLAALAAYFAPTARRALVTVSTDDAYVNGHVTLVAARVPGQVKRVLVDNNDRVAAGDVLMELDPEPYQVLVNIKTAAVAAAEADRVAAEAQVRGAEAKARSLRWKLQSTMEDIGDEVALVKARVAAVRSRQAVREKTRADFVRGTILLKDSSIGKEEYDLRREAFRVAEAQVVQSLEDVYEARAKLGLVPRPAPETDLDALAATPADLEQTQARVRQALAELVQTLTEVGYPLAGLQVTPKEFLAELGRFDGGKSEVLLAKLIAAAPAVRQADARLAQARRDLDEAKLNLKYCTIWAEIPGVVARRAVNPGNNVTAGQAVMAVRSLTEIWVDCNFKETQLDALAIGQRAEVEVDMYGDRRVFRGRISGFTPGTGQALALLPPQNATGNFVKITQRLPVRIELDDYDPDAEPLYAGLSAVPYIFYKEPPTGPQAGKRLRAVMAGR